MLQVTEAGMNLINAMGNCLQLINNNGGFTITGWYKRGSMNDKGLLAPRNDNANSTTQNSHYNNNNEQDAAQVGSGELTYHIVNIVPTNRDFLDVETDLGALLNNAKFDTSTIIGSV